MVAWLGDHILEIFGAVTGIIFVFLEMKQNIWLWPLGIITSAVYIWVFYSSKFYADMGLQFYYLGISVLGWYWWLRGGREGAGNLLKISRITHSQIIKSILVFVTLQALIWYILKECTDSPLPFGDAFTTTLSIIATWMLARKILEHWMLWVIADIASVGLYLYKGLYPTVILFIVYTSMAVIGFRMWKKEINRQEENILA